MNDGMQLTAALADYYFWWAHRLYDWAESGNAGSDEDAVRFLAKWCARAALAEIVDIAGLLVHEITHLGHFVDSLWECRADQVGLLLPTRYLKCACFMNSWIFRARVTADLALPLPLLPDTSSGESGDDQHMPRDRDGVPRQRFDFRADEEWNFQYNQAFAADCIGATFDVEHNDLWSESHFALGMFDYPEDCGPPNEAQSWGFAFMNT